MDLAALHSASKSAASKSAAQQPATCHPRSLVAAHAGLFSLLDDTRPRILAYNPSASSRQPGYAQQLEVALLSDLATLQSLANEFYRLLKRCPSGDAAHVLRKHAADLAVTAERERREEWLNELDARGVEIWNHASQLKRVLESLDQSALAHGHRKQGYIHHLSRLRRQNTHSPAHAKRPRSPQLTLSDRVYASMRQLGFVLLQAGTPNEIDASFALRLLNVAVKSAKTQLAVRNLEWAMKNVDIAAKYEDDLDSFQASQVDGGRDYAKTMLEYYTTKADCSWANGNDAGMLFNVKKALELCIAKPNLLELKDVIYVVSRLHAFAHEVLRTQEPGTSGADDNAARLSTLVKACEWLTVGLEALEHQAIQKDPGANSAFDVESPWKDLKLKVLKALAYASTEAGSCESETTEADALRERGERALDEAIALKPDQTMCLVKLQLQARGTQVGPQLKSAFHLALKTTPFNKQLIGKLMSVAHKVSDERARVEIFASIFLACVTREKEEERTLGDASFYAIVLNSIASRKNSANAKEASPFTGERTNLNFVHETADSATLNNSRYRLASDCAFMAQTVIWHFADQEYQRANFETAASWYELGTHPIFLENEKLTFSKLIRKASLSWINHGDYESSRRCLNSLPSYGQTEAATHFLTFMVEVSQGNEEQASQAINRMTSSVDFKPETLLYAARQADHRGLQGLFHDILQKLLEATLGGARDRTIQGVELVILLRSLIRVDISNFTLLNRDKDLDARKLLQHFQLAKQLMLKAQAGEELELNKKDASWFWKTAFNNCIGLTSEWPPELILEFFDITGDLIALAQKLPSSLGEVQSLVHHEIHCRFASLAGRLNQSLTGEIVECEMASLYQSLSTSILQLQNLCESAVELPSDVATSERLRQIRSCLCVWDFEVKCLGRDWKSIDLFLQDLGHDGENFDFVNTHVLETLADIACHHQTLPVKCLTYTLETVLEIYQKKERMELSTCSRWLRLIIDLHLSNGNDRSAIKCAEGALNLTKTKPGAYPSDEANWLLACSWDRSIDLYSSKDIENSRLWCEVSLKWMKLVVGGRSYESMMNRHYQDLLKLTESIAQPDNLLDN